MWDDIYKAPPSLLFKVFSRGVRGEEHLGQQQGQLCKGLHIKRTKEAIQAYLEGDEYAASFERFVGIQQIEA
jgi:hypothetical protein